MAGRFGGYSSVVHGSIQVKPFLSKSKTASLSLGLNQSLSLPSFAKLVSFLQKLILFAFAYEERKMFHSSENKYAV